MVNHPLANRCMGYKWRGLNRLGVGGGRSKWEGGHPCGWGFKHNWKHYHSCKQYMQAVIMWIAKCSCQIRCAGFFQTWFIGYIYVINFFLQNVTTYSSVFLKSPVLGQRSSSCYLRRRFRLCVLLFFHLPCSSRRFTFLCFLLRVFALGKHQFQDLLVLQREQKWIKIFSICLTKIISQSSNVAKLKLNPKNVEKWLFLIFNVQP